MAEDDFKPRRKLRVLLVGDCADDREMYAEFLAGRGYVIATASDGEEAVHLALKGRFDAILLDMALPKLDGIGVLMLLRSYPKTRRVPVITLSARTGEEARSAATDAGANLVLEKPCTPEELETVLRVYLERGRTPKGSG